jgi:predicted transcriptional regulator of viral defense system
MALGMLSTDMPISSLVAVRLPRYHHSYYVLTESFPMIVFVCECETSQKRLLCHGSGYSVHRYAHIVSRSRSFTTVPPFASCAHRGLSHDSICV